MAILLKANPKEHWAYCPSWLTASNLFQTQQQTFAKLAILTYYITIKIVGQPPLAGWGFLPQRAPRTPRFTWIF